MKKYLLPQRERYYKANLHTHSTVSDGKLTPEQVRDSYKEKGYSILALTDHSVMVEHQELTTEDFVMLTGVEIDMDDSGLPDARGRQRHLCLISKDPKRQWIPFRDPAPIPTSIPYEAVNEIAGMSRAYEPDAMNAVIAECNRQDFLVTYNHPVWSLENYPDYAPLKGLWGMEYRNSASLCSGFDENNGQIYQDLLNLGNRIVPIFADDMHSVIRPNGSSPLGMSWIMVGAEKLEYGAVYEALERGDLYGSCGPEIHEISLEDGVLNVSCSPCRSIQLITHTRSAQLALDSENCNLTEAKFPLTKWLDRCKDHPNVFFRILVTAADGSYAASRAYFADEL